MEINLWSILVTIGVPSAITGLCFWFLQRKLTSRENDRVKREEAKKAQELFLVQGIYASIALGESTAIALKNGKCNGETERAMNYAQKVKRDHKDFLAKQGIENLFD